MLPVLLAEQQMRAIEAASAPYMEKSDARKTIDKYQAVVAGREAAPIHQSLSEALAQIPMKRVEVPKEA